MKTHGRPSIHIGGPRSSQPNCLHCTFHHRVQHCGKTFNRLEANQRKFRVYAEGNGLANEVQTAGPKSKQKLYDVVALGNLCVDIVVQYEKVSYWHQSMTRFAILFSLNGIEEELHEFIAKRLKCCDVRKVMQARSVL